MQAPITTKPKRAAPEKAERSDAGNRRGRARRSAHTARQGPEAAQQRGDAHEESGEARRGASRNDRAKRGARERTPAPPLKTTAQGARAGPDGGRGEAKPRGGEGASRRAKERPTPPTRPKQRPSQSEAQGEARAAAAPADPDKGSARGA